ncbi:DUF5681 domain-containing protein [Brevundimonas sp.]|uniref:DUF5681 domain-containing protein n=1 Tax=Brevundimonas sp. TaxID=1871086 RepID=UPI00289DA528|nr:DUF5681 domain-containing protein [Brevundimonas sp.]
MTEQHDQNGPEAQKPARMWERGGPSPNPKGRPPGIVDKRTRVSQALLDDAPAVARVVVDAALEGDMQAASLVLSRIAPVLRGQMEKVAFEFDTTAPVARQVEQVLAAVARGQVAPDVGKQIIDAVQALSTIRATEELEARLAALEQKELNK